MVTFWGNYEGISQCAALILMSFWFRRGNRKRKGFLFHAVQFLIYTIIISAVGSI
ncbi:hypothetical protein ACGW7L_004327, partial [Shigella sonnei]